MGKTLSEEHAELYHYTTAAGLEGIVQTQQLWATNIKYLNDAEEHTGFFTRRFLDLLDTPIREACAKIIKTLAQQLPDDFSEETAVQGYKNDLYEIISAHMLTFNTPYVTSFCRVSSQEVAGDGLLSQWRGYGSDGGYAIVFETKGLQKLIEEEAAKFGHQFMSSGNVTYHLAAADSEIVDLESRIQKTIYDVILVGAGGDVPSEAYDPLYVPLTHLACSHKHNGFREEEEVRIIAVPWNDLLLDEEQKERARKKGKGRSGARREAKAVAFRRRNGVLVPYLKLFGWNKAKLPISRVIVGPHPEKEKRRNAVELLLKQHGMKADVTVSTIPYLGY